MTEDEATGTADFDLSAWEPDRVRALLAPAPGSVALARSAVDALLAADPRSECAANLKLVVSELVSNAVTHTCNGEEIQLVLIRYLRHVHVSVHNGGSAIDLTQFRRGSSGGGRGLDIVAALSEGWSIDTGQTGTTFTARVPAPYPPSISEQASEPAPP